MTRTVSSVLRCNICKSGVSEGGLVLETILCNRVCERRLLTTFWGRADAADI